ncbi:MAG: class C sortase [Gemmiger sp.]
MKQPSRRLRGALDKTWVRCLLILLLLVMGAGIFLYPSVSTCLAEQVQMTAVADYDAAVDTLTQQEYAAQWRLAREYNETLMGEPVHDPFLLGSGMALPQNYLETLNVNGVMGTVRIPKISVELPIYHGTDAQTLEKGVGHIRQTALPIGGSGVHAVLTGHSGLPSARLFDDLNKLETGDLFFIDVLGEVHAYQVDDIQVVLPGEVEALNPVAGRDLVTLITCTPYGINTHRLLVRGTRVEYQPQEEQRQQEQASGRLSSRQLLGINCTLVAVVFLYAFGLVRRRLNPPETRHIHRAAKNRPPQPTPGETAPKKVYHARRYKKDGFGR